MATSDEQRAKWFQDSIDEPVIDCPTCGTPMFERELNRHAQQAPQVRADDYLQAQTATVQRLLIEAVQSGDIVGAMSMNARLTEILDALAANPQQINDRTQREHVPEHAVEQSQGRAFTEARGAEAKTSSIVGVTGVERHAPYLKDCAHLFGRIHVDGKWIIGCCYCRQPECPQQIAPETKENET